MVLQEFLLGERQLHDKTLVRHGAWCQGRPGVADVRFVRNGANFVFTLGLPAAFLVLQAGARADRWDRRGMLIPTQLAGAVVMAATAVLVGADRISLGWMIVATLLAGSASAIGAPVRSSLLPALVPREQLFGAIALNAIAMTLSLILGPRSSCRARATCGT
jgi:MFS family permease